MFYNANLYKVGLMNSQRHGGQRSTSVTFSTPEIPGAGRDLDPSGFWHTFRPSSMMAVIFCHCNTSAANGKFYNFNALWISEIKVLIFGCTTLVSLCAWRLDIRRPISCGRTSQNTKWSLAKYLVRKLPDESTCVPWVQNGGIHGL